jgi:YD repeat-containing protein
MSATTRLGRPTAALRWIGSALLAALMTLAGTHGHAGVEVPFASCSVFGVCPQFNGSAPLSLEAAVQAGCLRFAASNRPGTPCPCDGTPCTILQSCTVISLFSPGSIGGTGGASHFDATAIYPPTGQLIDYGDRTDSGCTCPQNAGLTANGTCQCNGNTVWDGRTCLAPSACTSQYLDTCSPSVVPDKNCPNCEKGVPEVANPILPGAAVKFERQSVLADRTLGLDLTYVSKRAGTSALKRQASFGVRWTSTYDRRLLATFSGGKVGAARHDGRVLQFLPPSSGDSYIPQADITDRLVYARDAGGAIVGWHYYDSATEAIETYDTGGLLTRIDLLGGQYLVFTYSTASTPLTTAGKAGLLIQVDDNYGRSLQFFYNVVNRVSRVVDVAGQNYLFDYDDGTPSLLPSGNGAGNLIAITFPDSKVRRFHYNESANTSGASLPNSLTGITDENNVRFATFKYDTQGRPVSTEHAGVVELYTIAYNPDGSAVVTDPLATARTYGFATLIGVAKNTGITGPVCPSCGPASQTFDANGNVSSRVDWNGNRTNFTYDLTRNLESSRTEGLTSGGGATPETRTIGTQWDANFRLPTGVAEPLRITMNVYDPDGTVCGARGALCSKTIQATTDANGSLGFGATATGAPRSWAYTYNANGSVLTMNGPRTEVSDVTTYTYYANDDADLGKRGNVATITNAAGHVTSITAYDLHGQPLTIVDPNGLTTTLTYDPRQRLTSRTVGTETTAYEYDGVGQLTKITLPDTSFLTYGYDGAHRLTGMQDNLGNHIDYTLDAMGNRTQEQVFDPSSTLAQTRSRVFNNLNRLFQEIGAASQVTQYAYDDQGNVTSVTDPLSKITSNAYDALNRLRQVTDPALGVTQYAYNGSDALTSVTDPRSLTTSYSVDGLGNLTLQQSPDTGNTANTYDAAGNLLSQTDAKSQTTTYAYDALNRVTLITFQDGSKQAYAYDLGTNGLGRLSSITETDPGNTVTNVTAYSHDPHGRVTSETRTLGGHAYVTAYSYDASGRMDGMTYPSGRTVAYAFDALGRVNQVTTTKPGDSPQVVVQNVTYHPFGGVTGFTFGNGQVYSRSVDQDGRIASYTLGSSAFAIAFDAASRITGITETGNPSNANTYGYDTLDRLTSAVLPSTSYGYSYDAVGNRLTKTVGAASDNYAYSPTSNRIASITPASGPLKSFTFDANGSTLADSVNTYAYDARGRMVQAVSTVGTTDYQVNALGQRVRKTNSAGDAVFTYDTRGHLIAETDPGGTVKRELIYLGDIPIGAVQ